METQDVGSASLKLLVRNGARTDPEVKDHAFRIWIENGRSWRLTHLQTGVAVRTLHEWASRDHWEDRRLESAASFLPGASAETAFALKLAAHNAAIRLQQIAFEAVEYGTEPQFKEVQALLGIVDRGGYSPVGSRNPLDTPTSIGQRSCPNQPDFSTMSPDELYPYEQEFKKRSRPRIG